MAVNNIKGRFFVLYVLSDGIYKKLGGLTSKSINRDNPVEDTTSSSTPTQSNETESCFVGRSTLTINGSGIVDLRASADVESFREFEKKVNSSEPVLNLRLASKLSTYTGLFNVTSFEITSEEVGLVNFNATFQNAGEIQYS